MELKRLNHLVALAEERSFVRAARRVHLTQPALSRSIQAAEAEYGIVLFERGGAEVTCTPAGNFVVERARRVLAGNRSLEQDVLQFRERRMGDVSIALGNLVAAVFLSPLLIELRARYPDINATVVVGSSAVAANHLLTEKADLAVLWDQTTVGGAVEIQRIGRLRSSFFVRSGHPLATRTDPTVAEVFAFGLATPGVLAVARDEFARQLGLSTGAEIPIRTNCDDIEALRAVALATDTVLVVTDTAVGRDVAEGRLIRLQPQQIPKIEHHIAIMYLKGRTLSPMAQIVVDFVTRYAGEIEALQ